MIKAAAFVLVAGGILLAVFGLNAMNLASSQFPVHRCTDRASALDAGRWYRDGHRRSRGAVTGFQERLESALCATPHIRHQRTSRIDHGYRFKGFNDEKGFGFITPEGGGKDLFAHYTAVQSEGHITLRETQEVSFEVNSGGRGNQATNIQLLD